MESEAIKVFFTHLKSLDILPIVWPNVYNADVQEEQMYLRADIINTRPRTIKTNGRSRHKWILQVSVYFKENIGVFKPAQIADSVIAGVPFNTVLESGGYTFKTTSQGEVMPYVRDDAWLFIPLQFTFQAFK